MFNGAQWANGSEGLNHGGGASSLLEVHLLCSGGLDSTTLAFHYRSLGHELHLHWMDYGQENKDMEWMASKWVAGTTGASLHAHRLDGLRPRVGEVPGRNAAFIETLARHVGGPALIALGIHAGCEYEDTQPPFQRRMQSKLDGLFGGLVQLDCPFINMPKAEVAEAAVALGVPIEQTYSCDLAGPEPCDSCRSCLERKSALVGRPVALLA